MTGIRYLIQKYEDILKQLEEQEFENARIFKGFSEEEEHDLNMVVDYKDSSKSSMLDRLASLQENLTELLDCKVSVTTSNWMDKYYLDKLETNKNYVLLGNKKERALEKELTEVFGEDWKFSEIEKPIKISSFSVKGKEKNKSVKIMKKQTYRSDVDSILELEKLKENLAKVQLQTERLKDQFLSSEVKLALKQIKDMIDDQIKIFEGAQLTIPEIDILPDELRLRIFSFLDTKDICRARQVSHFWNRIGSDQTLWVGLLERKFNITVEDEEKAKEALKLLSRLSSYFNNHRYIPIDFTDSRVEEFNRMWHRSSYRDKIFAQTISAKSEKFNQLIGHMWRGPYGDKTLTAEQIKNMFNYAQKENEEGRKRFEEFRNFFMDALRKTLTNLDPNEYIFEETGDTALHAALELIETEDLCYDVINTLIEHKADIQKENNQGISALNIVTHDRGDKYPQKVKDLFDRLDFIATRRRLYAP